MAGWGQYTDWNNQAAATGWNQYGYGGAGAGSYGGAADGGYGGAGGGSYGGVGAGAGYGGAGAGSYGGAGAGAGAHSSWAAQPPPPGTAEPQSKGGLNASLLKMAEYSGPSKFSAYDTSRNVNKRGEKRSRDDRDGGSAKDGAMKRPKYKGREGREPELALFVDPRFRYWNLPAKARVLLVSNVPQALNSPELLYNLFSFYGDVVRIKIIRRKTDCALIEFTTATFAAIARDYIDNLVFKGTQLVVSFSRFDRVRLPNEIGITDDGQTKDFSGEEYKTSKRYGTEELKKANMKKIVGPKKVIHINGMEGNVSPNGVRDMLASVGAQVADIIGLEMKKTTKKAGVTTQVKSNKMFAYAELASVDDAILAIANFGCAKGYRLSFSKDEITQLKESFEKKNIKVLTGDETVN